MGAVAREREAGQVELERLFGALCSLRTAEEAAALLHDLCTPREIADLAQRLEVATMLAGGASYLDVSHATGASSTTVSRVSKCLNGPAGGYRLVLGRLDGR
ncbi:YerC/YecD family TrpR-related protein [Thermophilibacter sp.]